ncbi:unnamed protein product [Caenorhabditis brenneri]
MYISIFIILNIIVPTITISCYNFNFYSNHPLSVRHNSTICSAYFEIDTERGTFAGADKNSTELAKLKSEYTKTNDCKLEKHKIYEEDDYTVVYACYCYTSLCNQPFSYKEFVSRGYTLAAQLSNAGSV